MKRDYVKPEVIASANGSLEGVFAHRGGFGGGGNNGNGNNGNNGNGNNGNGNNGNHGRPGWSFKDDESIEESSGWH